MQLLASKRTLVVIALAVAVAACDTKSPVGPSGVTLSSTSTSTTTSVPPGGGGDGGATTTSSSTTTSVALRTSRTFVSLGAPVLPTIPTQLTMVLTPFVGRSSVRSWVTALFETQADPVWTVQGFYITSGGGNGKVTGQFVGTFDNGVFTGTLTADTPSCIAEREYGGTIDTNLLRWTGGRTLADCKGSPLSFDTLTMLATDAPLQTTTAISSSTTSTPLQCSYSSSVNAVSVEAAGGQRSVGVTTSSACNWTVQNFVDWITVQPTFGTGAGTVTLTIAPNQGPQRNATVVIAGLPVVVSQAAPSTPTTSTTTSTSTSSTSTTSTSSTTSTPTSTSTSSTTSTSTTTSIESVPKLTRRPPG